MADTCTEKRLTGDELWWENPCCVDPLKAKKTCKALQDGSSEHLESTDFPPVKRMKALESHSDTLLRSQVIKPLESLWIHGHSDAVSNGQQSNSWMHNGHLG